MMQITEKTSRDELNDWFNKTKYKTLKLESIIPVVIPVIYFTTDADEDGKIIDVKETAHEVFFYVVYEDWTGVV